MSRTLIAAACAVLLAAPASAQIPNAVPGLIGAIGREAARAREQPSQPQPYLPGGQDASGLCNRWDSAGRSRFHHLIEGPAGRARLVINATTDASGGETVAIYPSVNGERGRVRILFVIATTRGHSSQGYVTIPRPAPGEASGRVPIIVDVENAGGRRHRGDYCITVHPGG